MRISDWSSDVCSSDLAAVQGSAPTDLSTGPGCRAGGVRLTTARWPYPDNTGAAAPAHRQSNNSTRDAMKPQTRFRKYLSAWLTAGALTSSLCALGTHSAQAAAPPAWPTRPITLLVPTAAGGGTEHIPPAWGDKPAAAPGPPHLGK